MEVLGASVVAAVVGVRLRGRIPQTAGMLAGMGCWMLAVSGVAFAAQGLLPLDVNSLDGPISQRHAAAWLLWWVAFIPGAAALAAGLGLAALFSLAAFALAFGKLRFMEMICDVLLERGPMPLPTKLEILRASRPRSVALPPVWGG